MFEQARSTGSWISVALLGGTAFPILYFAVQIALVPFAPGYDYARDVASQLGAPASPIAGVFNTGVMFLGVIGILAGVGQFAQMFRLGVNIFVALIAGLCVVSLGGATLWAGLVPLPDPAHGASGPYMLAGVLYPALLLIVFRRSPLWRLVFTFAIIAVGASAAVMMGVTGIDLAQWEGAVQRPVALALLGPAGLGSFALWRGKLHSA